MIIAIIPAKGGSKRLPNKNMCLILNKPMLHYAIDYAKNSRKILKIYISTDDNNIAEYSKSQGIEVIFRSEDLGGETPLLDVYYHAISSLDLEELNTIVGVQPDHPDRTISLDYSLHEYETQGLDFLYSVDSKSQKNGAHSIMDANGLIKKSFNKKGFIVDDCTNVHYLEDLKTAENNLKYQNGVN